MKAYNWRQYEITLKGSRCYKLIPVIDDWNETIKNTDNISCIWIQAGKWYNKNLNAKFKKISSYQLQIEIGENIGHKNSLILKGYQMNKHTCNYFQKLI